jgi:hypothetical protein
MSIFRRTNFTWTIGARRNPAEFSTCLMLLKYAQNQRWKRGKSKTWGMNTNENSQESRREVEFRVRQDYLEIW